MTAPAIEDDGQHGPGSTLLTFRIYWLDGDGVHVTRRVAAGRVTVTTDVRRHGLSAAITFACNRLKRPGSDKGALDACGFYVRVVR